ncbi:helix-turn-helix domain-containing protein [Saccharopolyspora sp. ASAGF58]|uniref:helix-turn-helix domain-containing protein n=1 Tax=Saccharopolyspora sp. ASAGF58 TaxID=2719023 RepID=UPI00143FBC83|nr:helix-turn-helix domain-containing protein [Saccharopolyspora sp. ASAGF58]QIZ38351.1 hypothetical protein FDZ84_32210 [Saccharopolyspora sp. ASAGF58]
MSVADTRESSVAGAHTLDRGIRILWHLAERPNGETLTEMARSLGINRNALHRCWRCSPRTNSAMHRWRRG